MIPDAIQVHCVLSGHRRPLPRSRNKFRANFWVKKIKHQKMLNATIPLFLNYFDLSRNPVFCDSGTFISFFFLFTSKKQDLKKLSASMFKTIKFHGTYKNHEGAWSCIGLPRNHKQQSFCKTYSNTFLERRSYPVSAQNSHLNDFNFTIYGHPWHNERLWSYICLPRNHELELFSKFQQRLFNTKICHRRLFHASSAYVWNFVWAGIWLPSFLGHHIWLGYGCQDLSMVVNPGFFLFVSSRKNWGLNFFELFLVFFQETITFQPWCSFFVHSHIIIDWRWIVLFRLFCLVFFRRKIYLFEVHKFVFVLSQEFSTISEIGCLTAPLSNSGSREINTINFSRQLTLFVRFLYCCQRYWSFWPFFTTFD